jgi:hypothetical protein
MQIQIKLMLYAPETRHVYKYKIPVSCTTSCYLYTPTTFTSYYKHYANLNL